MRISEIRAEVIRISKVSWEVSWRYLNKRRVDLFPERQIILRQRDTIKSYPLSSRHQVTVASIAIGCTVWMVWSTVGYVYSSHKISVKQGQILTTLVAYEDMVNQVASERDKLVSITNDLDYYRSYLTALVEKNQAAQKDGKIAQAADPEAAQVAETEKALQERLASIKGEISGFTQASTQLTEGAGKLSSQLAGVGSSKSDKIDFAVARAALGFRVAQLEKQLAESSSRITDLQTALSVEQQSAEQALQSRRAALDEKAAIAEKLAVAEKRVVDISAQHEQSLAKLAEQTHSTIAQIERIMVSTGIDAKRILQMRGEAKPARGGPFVPWHGGQSKDIDLQNTPATATLTFDIDRINQLKLFISTLPLGSPLTEFMVSGPFGYRVDPFNNHPAYHTGLDMLAPMGTQVVAPAPGKVITAQRSGDYGNMVEIDHGYGIVTRYAHLQKFDVTEGQMVALHDPVGRVGQTGRAEAPHLHYEVRVDGEARNPINFLRAISNVLVSKNP